MTCPEPVPDDDDARLADPAPPPSALAELLEGFVTPPAEPDSFSMWTD